MAIPDKSLVSTGKAKVGGSVFVADTDATLPTDATSSLSNDFVSLGYVSEDGVTNSNSPEIDTQKAWGGDVVITLQTGKEDTFSFKLISSMDTDVLKEVYGQNNVTGTLQQGVVITADSKQLPARAWVIEQITRDDGLRRIVIPNGQVTEIGEIVYKDDEATGYEITIAALPNASGATHKEYLYRATVTPQEEEE